MSRRAPLTLLLDMDGPIADFDPHFWDRCIAEGWAFDVEHPGLQQHRFFTEHMPDKAQRKLARAMVDSAGWFESLPIVAGAREGVDALLAAGIDVWVCTKPLEVNPTCRDAKGAWLREHLPELERRLIIAPDKSYVHGEWLLDDAPALEQCKRATWQPVVYTCAYNGAGSEWAHLPHWQWSDGIDNLLELMAWSADD